MTYFLALIIGVAAGMAFGYRLRILRETQHAERRLPEGVHIVEILVGDEHVISDGQIIRYHGTDGDTAEHIWIQLERHGIKGFHSWHKNGKPFAKRAILA